MSEEFTFGIQVKLKHPDDFLKVRETLTRIGVSSNREKVLYQSAHILHKRGNYYIMHFKEFFALDGKESTIDEEDIARRNLICALLQQWGLLKVVREEYLEPCAKNGSVKVVPYREKNDWDLRVKYTVGVDRNGA